MSDLSFFKSRSGELTCNAEQVFAFVTDIRNFEQFIPEGSIKSWHAEKESCSFSVSMIGNVTVILAEKEKANKVVFKGDALKKNDFTVTLNITENVKNQADVNVILNADLNPMMKMLASKPINQFLEMLINEMERFRGWENVKE